MGLPSKKTEGGHSASHPSRGALPVHAATSTKSERTVIREELTTVACWRLNDVRFDFGSSFVGPAAAPEFDSLHLVCQAHPGAPLAVFGHADPIGDDEFNKLLSGRRAEAIYAILTGDFARWEKLYANPLGGDYWGSKHIQIILGALGYTSGDSNAIPTFAVQACFSRI
jgi:outer membrane protein OmpA-like peptidoglycan-associated protein